MERLPQLNYSLMNDNALRKKVGGLGIPAGGPRTLVEKRHVEWVNLVNANCDSNKPRTKRELLKDLEIWDRSQGRQISSGLSGSTDSNAVMRKDFDGAAWAANHNDDFQRLIDQARPKLLSNNEPNMKTRAKTNSPSVLGLSNIDISPENAAKGIVTSEDPSGRPEQPFLSESEARRS